LNKSLSVVIPIYNSQDSLPILLRDLEKVLKEITKEYEIILINDGSQDNSWEVIEELCKKIDRIRAFDLSRNFGQHNATLCGVRNANFEIIITLDDDLQNPPEMIPTLLDKLNEGYDVVYGTPMKVRQVFWRTMASNTIRLLLHKIMGNEIAWRVSSFRAFRTSIRDAFADYSSPSVFIDVLLTWGATKFTSVSIKQEFRENGGSTYSLRKLLDLAITMVTSFSTLPLRVASLTGFLFTLFGIGVLIYVLARYIAVGGSIPGFPFLASVISIFSGAILFSLGIMGEYLARMYIRSMGQPPYFIRRG